MSQLIGQIRLVGVLLLFGLSSAGCGHRDRTSQEKETQESAVLDDARYPLLITVSISPEARVKAAAEEIAMVLTKGEWQSFSIEIDNAAGITAPLAIESDQLLDGPDDMSREHWLEIELEPNGQLSGSRSETRTLRFKSRDAGVRTAILNFNAGQGTQDLGFRSDVLVTFKVQAK